MNKKAALFCLVIGVVVIAHFLRGDPEHQVVPTPKKTSTVNVPAPVPFQESDPPIGPLEAAEEVNRAGWHAGCALVEDDLPGLIADTLESDVFSFDAAYLAAGCLQEIYQEEDQAIAVLEHALSLANHPHLAHMLGNAYFRVGDDEKVEDLLEKLLGDEDGIDDQWQRGHGGSVRSILAASKVRLAGGTDTDRLYEARTLLEEASQIEGLQNVSPVRHGQLAQVSLALGDFDEAIREATLALELVQQNTVWDEGMTAAMKAENLMTLGQALYLQGDTENGNTRMDEAIDAVSNTPLQPVMVAIKRSMSEPVDIEQDPDSNISHAVPLEPHSYKEWSDE